MASSFQILSDNTWILQNDVSKDTLFHASQNAQGLTTFSFASTNTGK